MRRQPLPKTVDARKFAASGYEIHAEQPVSGLPRFYAGLASQRGTVALDLTFYRDEQGFYRIGGGAQVEVDVVCERCLDIMPINITAEFGLAVVWTDDQAKALPKSLDALIVGEEGLELAELLQDELILNTPFVNYHDPQQCSAPSNAPYTKMPTVVTGGRATPTLTPARRATTKSARRCTPTSRRGRAH